MVTSSSSVPEDPSPTPILTFNFSKLGLAAHAHGGFTRPTPAIFDTKDDHALESNCGDYVVSAASSAGGSLAVRVCAVCRVDFSFRFSLGAFRCVAVLLRGPRNSLLPGVLSAADSDGG